MADVLEAVFAGLLEGIMDVWTNFMRKRNPDYESRIAPKVITAVIGLLIVVLVLGLVVGVMFLISRIWQG